MITLKGDEVLTNLFVQPDALPYSATSKMASKFYHRAIYDGTVMTVSPEFYDAWVAGDVTSVSISEGKRMVKDASGAEAEVKAFAFNSYVKSDQMLKLKKGQKELAMVNGQIKAAEKGAEILYYKDLGLNQDEMKALLAEA